MRCGFNSHSIVPGSGVRRKRINPAALQVKTSAGGLSALESGFTLEIFIMPHLAIIVAVAVAILLAIYLIRHFFELVTVREFESALKYSQGRFAGTVGPGLFLVCKPLSQIVKVETRPQYATLVGQEVLSRDSIGLKVSIAAQYQIVDPVVAVHQVQNCSEALYLTLQLALREIIGGRPIDELLENRGEFDKQLFEKCEPQVQAFGLKLLSARIRDITFPGELKKVFAQVVKARKEGLAALEKARGETAALRNLANAAKVMESNPTLLQLRMIQALGESSGNTLVLGMPSGQSPLPLKAEQRESVPHDERKLPEKE